MSTESNKNVVRSFFDSFSAGMYEAALSLLADTATVWVAGKPESFVLAGTKTKAQFSEKLNKMVELLPKGMRITLKEFTAEGDRVAVEAEGYGETVSGKIYNSEYHFLVEVRDGKIQAMREYLDTLHAKEALLDQ